MAESRDAHIVEIRADEEQQAKLVSAIKTVTAIAHHPLMEISQSPGHLLLLKLWQREEDLFGRRMSMKETRLDTIRKEIFQYWKVWEQLQRERNDNRAVVRCIQELRMKGESFDLSKEPLSGKRMKSSSVEIKWKPLIWCSDYLVTICLVFFSGLVFPASRLILCI